MERHGIRKVVGRRRHTPVPAPTGRARVSRAWLEEVRARWEAARAWRVLWSHLATLPPGERILTACAHCGAVRTPAGGWVRIPDAAREECRTPPRAVLFSHGICPPCLARYYAEYLPA